jgi:signal transduction histidine kinase
LFFPVRGRGGVVKKPGKDSFSVPQRNDVITDILLSACIVIPLTYLFLHYDLFKRLDTIIHAYPGMTLELLFSLFLAFLVAGTVLALRHTTRLNGVIKKLEEAESKLRFEGQRKIEREKLASLGELAGGLAHEINNALVPSIGMSEIVKKRLEKTDPELAQYVNVIYESSLHGRKIVQNVLAFARGQDADHEILDAAEVTRDALTLCRPLLPKKRRPVHRRP